MLGISIQRAAAVTGVLVTLFSVSNGSVFDLDATSVLGTCEGGIAYKNSSDYERVEVITFDHCQSENDYGWILSCASTTSVSVQKYQYRNCTGTMTTETSLSEGDLVFGEDDETIYFNCASDAEDCSYVSTFYSYGSDSSCADGNAVLLGEGYGLMDICEWERDYSSSAAAWEYESSYVGCSGEEPFERRYNESIDCATGYYEESEHVTTTCAWYATGGFYLKMTSECASCSCATDAAVSHDVVSAGAHLVAVAIIAQMIHML